MKEPDTVDLRALDPTRSPRWNDSLARVAARGRELQRLRRAVVRRGAVAVVLAAAAAIALWMSAPKRDVAPPAPMHAQADSGAPAILSWAMHDVDPSELLELGGPDAQ